mmetsp:Transcript_1835/g.5011  ORF Transcript_1835/g.5011 Transcript_1835/m.5011 type:complete len:311 (-) Transcript_1835:282-1214(-)
MVTLSVLVHLRRVSLDQQAFNLLCIYLLGFQAEEVHGGLKGVAREVFDRLSSSLGDLCHDVGQQAGFVPPGPHSVRPNRSWGQVRGVRLDHQLSPGHFLHHPGQVDAPVLPVVANPAGDADVQAKVKERFGFLHGPSEAVHDALHAPLVGLERAIGLLHDLPQTRARVPAVHEHRLAQLLRQQELLLEHVLLGVLRAEVPVKVEAALPDCHALWVLGQLPDLGHGVLVHRLCVVRVDAARGVHAEGFRGLLVGKPDGHLAPFQARPGHHQGPEPGPPRPLQHLVDVLVESVVHEVGPDVHARQGHHLPTL